MSVTYADMSEAYGMDDDAIEGDGYAWPDDTESTTPEDNAFVGLIGQSPSIQCDVELARKMEIKARASQQPQQHHDSRLPNGRTAVARVSFESGGFNGESAGREDELRRQISSNSTSELSFQNEALREENQQLSSEVKRLGESTNNHAPAAPSENNSEGRLRRALTTKGTTTAELRQAIQAVEALVEEARRELERAMLRERRAAYEALYHAIDRGDEEILELAIEKARLAEVQIEDLTKGEAKLADLRAMSPEQKAKKLATELESKRKKEAFILIKRDDTEALTALLESLNEDVQWRNWRDYAGRSLWKCALDLRATRVQFYLAPLVGQRLPEEHALANGKRASVRPSIMLPAGGMLGSFTSEDGKRPSIGSPSNSRLYPNGMGGSRGSLLSTGSGSARHGGESPTGGSPSLLAQVPPMCVRQISETEVLGNDPLLLPAAPDLNLGGAALAESLLSGSHASSDSPARSGTGSVPSPDRNEAQETKLRMQAFRSVAQDDCDSLAEVLQSVHQDIWTKWMNKAGKDLLTLSTERGSDMAYSMLARELGMLKEAHRESFEERESVWVFEQGEVQPRRATVIEDTTTEEEEVLLEFWDGDDPPMKVDRCLIHKMYN